MYKIMVENIPICLDIDIQVHGAHSSQTKLNLARSSLRYIMAKLSKVKEKERILEVAKEKKHVIYRGISQGYQRIFQQQPYR